MRLVQDLLHHLQLAWTNGVIDRSGCQTFLTKITKWVINFCHRAGSSRRDPAIAAKPKGWRRRGRCGAHGTGVSPPRATSRTWRVDDPGVCPFATWLDGRPSHGRRANPRQPGSPEADPPGRWRGMVSRVVPMAGFGEFTVPARGHPRAQEPRPAARLQARPFRRCRHAPVRRATTAPHRPRGFSSPGSVRVFASGSVGFGEGQKTGSYPGGSSPSSGLPEGEATGV